MSLTPVNRRALRPSVRTLRRASSRGVAVLATVVMLLTGTAALPASADEISAALTINKIASAGEARPGERLVWEVTAGCTSLSSMCVDSVVADTVPAPFVLEDVRVTGTTVEPVIERDGDGFSISFQERDPRFPGTVGLADGQRATIQVITRLPEGTPVAANDIPVTNVAEVSAANAAPRSASSTVTPKISAAVAVDATKEWSEKTQTVGGTTPNTLTLGVRNVSNVPASSLTITDPAPATGNPFDHIAFVAFGELIMPEGADRVAVTAVTATKSSTGPPQQTLELPTGVDPSTVIGLSFVFSSSEGELAADGSAGSAQLIVKQRPGLAPMKVVNSSSVAVVTAQGSAANGASDSFDIVPMEVRVESGKAITPPRIVATESSVVQLSARNASNIKLDTMTLTEPAPGTPGLAANGLTMVGFGADGTGALTGNGSWPVGATKAKVSYRYADGVGSAVEVDSLADWPAPQNDRTVTGFSIVYSGALVVGAIARVPFLVKTTLDTPLSVVNTVQVDGTGPGSTAEPSTSPATLTVEPPVVDSTVRKLMYPPIVGTAIGQEIVTTLTATVTKSNVDVTRIVLEDSANSVGGSDLWGRYGAQKLTATPVATEATLEVQYWNGSDWLPVAGGKFSGPTTVTDLELPSAAQGIRLIFEHSGATNGDQVAAKLVFESTEVVPAGTVLKNCAVSQAFGNPAQPGTRPVSCQSVTVSDDGTGGHVALVAQDTAKSWSPAALWIPETGAYPKSSLRFSIANRSPLPAATLSLEDPTGGTEPFEYVTVTKVSSIDIPAGADSNLSRVRLINADGSIEYDETGASAVRGALALGAARLANVVGIEVTVAGSIDTNQTLAVRVATQLRDTTRTDGVPIEAAMKALGGVVPNVVTGTASDGRDALVKTAQADLTIRPIIEQPLVAALTKTLNPEIGTILSADADRVIDLALSVSRVDGEPISYAIEDFAPTFWNAFDLVGVSAVTGAAKANALHARIDYLAGGTFALRDGSPAVTGATWRDGTPFTVPTGSDSLPKAAIALPANISADGVQGVRVAFLTPDGTVIPDFSANGKSGQGAVFSVTPRETLRTGGAVTDTSVNIPMPGETLAGTVTNEATATATNIVRTVTVDPAEDDFTLIPGTTALQVTKTPKNSLVVPGEKIPFSLTVSNTGSSPLVNPVITDVIPTDAEGALLEYDPFTLAEASFSVKPASASITTDPRELSLTVAEDGSSISVTFPEGSRIMPGEKYTVSLPMKVRAGVVRDTEFDNIFRFTADGGVSLADSAQVRVLEGAAYARVKDVREDVADGVAPTGLINTLDGSSECLSDGGFYRVPCLVKTRPGGTETWRLRLMNTGNLAATTVTIVDVLPYAGDTGVSELLSGISRGSTWAPEYLGNLEVDDLPAGTGTTVWYQTAADERCHFTGEPDSADPFGAGCAESRWHQGVPANLSAVTAFKVQFDFANGLKPGETVGLRYQTRTLDELPNGVDTSDAPAWNSMVVFTTTDKGNGLRQYESLEPNKAGIAFTLPEPSVSVGDFVWIDDNRDGIQQPEENGLPGVVLNLTGPDGEVVTDVHGKKVVSVTTDENGRYLFSGLPTLAAGESYRVTIDRAASNDVLYAYVPTTELAGDDRSADSSSWSEDSAELMNDGDVDLTLDFGFFIPKWELPTLPFTGFEAGWSLLVMFGLMLGGAVLIVIGRRRRRA